MDNRLVFEQLYEEFVRKRNRELGQDLQYDSKHELGFDAWVDGFTTGYNQAKAEVVPHGAIRKDSI